MGAANGAKSGNQRGAERLGGRFPSTPSGGTQQAPRELLHDLQVHPMELELQNEKLRAALAEAEALRQRYADFSEAAPVGFFTLAKDGTILEINRRGASLLAGDRAQLTGTRFGIRVDEGARRRFNTFLNGVFHATAPQACDLPLREQPGGERRTVRLHGVATSSGLECRVVATDITVQRRLEGNLEDARRQLDLHLQRSPLAVVEWDGDLRIARWAGEAQRVFGWTAEDVLGKRFDEFAFVYPADLPAVSQQLQSIADGGPPFLVLASRLVRKDGAVLHTEWYNSIVRDSAGRLTSVLSRVLDSTARTRAEALLRARVELAEVAAKGDTNDVLQCALKAAETVTGSELGFFHFVEANEARLALQTWSARTLLEGCAAQRQGTHELTGEAGVWAQCARTRRPVLHNDYASLPNRKEFPPHHSPLARVLVVPVTQGGKLVALCGVGNKGSNYTDDDADGVGELAAMAMEWVARKDVEAENARLLEQTLEDAATKQRLLDEINHRVKNNLIALQGLMLAEKRATPPEGLPWVEQSISRMMARVRGLVTTHQMLSAAQWAPLPLSELADALLRQCLDAGLCDGRVAVEVASSNDFVSPRQASNVALVLNELATNTLKYAVPARERIQVTVRFGEDDGFSTLEYRDDGPGYPPLVLGGAFPSLGLGLVASLVEGTLRGTLALFNEGGAVARIRIRKESLATT